MISRQKIKPLANTALIVTLERAQGQECQSQYAPDGKEYRYDVRTQDGQMGIIYLPAIARDLLIRSGASDGEEIRILKTGSNGSTRWQIDPVVSDRVVAPAPTRALPQSPEPATSSHPIQARMTRLCIAAAASLRDAHIQITADPFYAELPAPNWEDVRALAIHWNISAEKQSNGGRQ